MSPNKLILFCILLFPTSTILQGISIFGWINKGLIGIIIAVLISSFFVDRITISTLIILIITIPLSVLAIVYTRAIPYNINTILYLPFWIIYFLYMKAHYGQLMNLLVDNIPWLKWNVICWNFIVLVSMFIPSSYGSNWGSVYFTSFSNGEHRFASSCLFAFAMFWILVQLTREKKYYIYGILPLVGILLCGARTYLGGALLYLIAVYYIFWKNKKNFYISLIPLLTILGILIIVSPIGRKIITTFQGNGYWGYWATLTSGRSMFWVVDLQAFFKLSWWHRMVGNGLNYVFDVNWEAGHGKIWAHNDFINLLLSNGWSGAFLYLYTFLSHTHGLLKRKYKVPWVLLGVFYGIWLFNGFFNMVYTYTCTVLATPFILYSLCHLPQRESLDRELDYGKYI